MALELILVGCVILQFVLIAILWGRAELHAGYIRDLLFYHTLPKESPTRLDLIRRFVKDNDNWRH